MTTEYMKMLGQLIGAKTVVALPDLPAGDPLRERCMAIEHTFTTLMDYLRSHAGHPRIRRLCQLAWDLYGNRLVLTAIGPRVSSLYFMVGKGKTTASSFARPNLTASSIPRGTYFATVFKPHHWVDLVKENPQLQLGALVYTASKCADFYRSPDDMQQIDIIETRARAYEAQYLLSVPASQLQLTPHQEDVLRAFPKGLQSLAAGIDYEPSTYRRPS